MSDPTAQAHAAWVNALAARAGSHSDARPVTGSVEACARVGELGLAPAPPAPPRDTARAADYMWDLICRHRHETEYVLARQAAEHHGPSSAGQVVHVRDVFAVRDVRPALVLLECVADDPHPPVSAVRDLLALRALLEAQLVLALVGHEGGALTVRQLYPGDTPAERLLREVGDDYRLRDLLAADGGTGRALLELGLEPDLRQLLERMRRLNALSLGEPGHRYHIRLAELYFRRGRALVWTAVEAHHAANKLLERRYRTLKAALADAHTFVAREMLRSAASNRVGERLASRLEAALRETREAKREWVLCENGLGDLVQRKSKVEAFLESMRLKLLHVARNPRVYLHDPRRLDKLGRRLAVLNAELERDNDLHEQLARYTAHTAAARLRVETLLLAAEERLRERFWRSEAVLLRRAGSTHLEWLVANHDAIFGAARSEGSAWRAHDIDTLLREATRRIELPENLASKRLYAAKRAPSDQVTHVTAYAEQGFVVDLSRAQVDVLCGIVLRFVADKRLVPDEAAVQQVAVVRKAVRDMDAWKRHHLAHVCAHLKRVLEWRSAHDLPPPIVE